MRAWPAQHKVPLMLSARTRRLSIEPLDETHAESLFAALDDPRVGAHIGGPDVSTLPALRERIARLRAGPPATSGEVWANWAVLSDGTVIGRIEATLHGGIAEIAYVFGPRWWGRGYATEATRWLLDELRRQGVQACWATVAPENEASVRLLRRLGFVEVEPRGVSLLSYDDGDLTFVRR